jgi:hypothetical protein
MGKGPARPNSQLRGPKEMVSPDRRELGGYKIPTEEFPRWINCLISHQSSLVAISDNVPSPSQIKTAFLGARMDSNRAEKG